MHKYIEGPADQQACKEHKLWGDSKERKTISDWYAQIQGLSYLGEYPLAWAACLCNETVYNLLVGDIFWLWNPFKQLLLSSDEGADPDAQDTYGNTVLHMVVIVEQLGAKILESFIYWLFCSGQECLDMRWSTQSRRQTI